MKQTLRILSLMLLLLLCACAAKEPQQEKYSLYFTRNTLTSYGSALVQQSWDGEADAEAMMKGLLSGPSEEGMASPFPKGLNIQSLEVDEDAAMVRVTLSDHYSGLTDMAQTLADACIVMTLCQLPGIEAVEISTDGFWASRPASRTLRPEQMEMMSLLPEDFP